MSLFQIKLCIQQSTVKKKQKIKSSVVYVNIRTSITFILKKNVIERIKVKHERKKPRKSWEKVMKSTKPVQYLRCVVILFCCLFFSFFFISLLLSHYIAFKCTVTLHTATPQHIILSIRLSIRVITRFF